MLAHGNCKQLNRLFCRVNAWFTGLQCRNRPDTRRVILGDALWLAALYPSEETRLVLPHIPGAVEYRPVFHPNDLLVNEGAVLFPNAFDEPLFPARVPAVPSRVRSDRVFDGHPHKRVVELLALFRVVDIGILVGPVLIFPPFCFCRMVPLVWMIRTVVVHQVRWVSNEQVCSLAVH